MHVICIGRSYLEWPWMTIQTAPRKWVALSEAIRLLQELPAPSAHLSTAHREQAGEDVGQIQLNYRPYKSLQIGQN